VPAAHGGAERRLDVRALCLMRETLARFVGLADFAFAMQGLGTGAISLFGTPEQKARFLPPVREGRARAGRNPDRKVAEGVCRVRVESRDTGGQGLPRTPEPARGSDPR
jgi:alkylation response protein AidB-like acyl-CoA dehydrogenase